MSGGAEDSGVDDSSDIDTLLEELVDGYSPDDELPRWTIAQADEPVATTPSVDVEDEVGVEVEVEAALQPPAEPRLESPAEVLPEPDVGDADVIAPAEVAAEGVSDDRRSNRLLPLVLGTVAVVAVAGLSAVLFGIGSGSDDAEPVVSEEAAAPELTTSTTEATTTSTADTTSTSAAATRPSALVAALQSGLDAFGTGRTAFASGSAELTSDGNAAAAELAAVLLAYPTAPVELEVSTFSESSSSRNRALSAARGEAIVAALVAEGVNPDQLTFVGLGNTFARQVDGRTALVYETSDEDLLNELSAIDQAAPALDANDGLTAALRANLDQAAEVLNRHPDSSVTLLGYAYSDSPDTSHDQAHEVVDQATAYLASLGVDTERLRSIGMGDTSIEADLGTHVEVRIDPSTGLSLALAQIDTGLIAFEPGTDVLTPQSDAALADIAAVLVSNADGEVEIVAHAYTEGSSSANHDLSHLQGEAVVARLVEAGVAVDRLSVTGSGDEVESATGDSFVVLEAVG